MTRSVYCLSLSYTLTNISNKTFSILWININGSFFKSILISSFRRTKLLLIFTFWVCPRNTEGFSRYPKIQRTLPIQVLQIGRERYKNSYLYTLVTRTRGGVGWEIDRVTTRGLVQLPCRWEKLLPGFLDLILKILIVEKSK